MNNDKEKPTTSYTDRIGDEFKRVERMGSKSTSKPECEISSVKTCQKVLKELLAQVRPVDFREKAGLDDDAKISLKLYVVISIDEIVETAVANEWGLCTKDGFIYIYNGQFWQVVNDQDFKPFLAEAAQKMGVPVFDAKYHKVRDELYKQFLATAVLPMPEPSESILMNLLNGTLEINGSEQRLREPLREDFLKYVLPFKYDPDAKCPMFDRYLERVVPYEDCRNILAEYLGHVFTTIETLKLEKVLLLYGSGANGKSVFFEIVNAILGKENTTTYSLQNITKSESYRAELANKLLNYASEINGKLEQDTFKLMASGEPVGARHLYGRPFSMSNYAKLMFNCNELPKEVEQTNAFFRRFIIIPFTQTIPESEQDPELAKKIIASELSGIFNWILDGLRRILEQKKFTDSEIVKQQVESYRRESDSVVMFLEEEGYSQSTEEHIPLKDLYYDYQEFCRDNGHYPCSSRSMSDRLSKAGYYIKKIAQGRIVYAKK